MIGAVSIASRMVPARAKISGDWSCVSPGYPASHGAVKSGLNFNSTCEWSWGIFDVLLQVLNFWVRINASWNPVLS